MKGEIKALATKIFLKSTGNSIAGPRREKNKLDIQIDLPKNDWDAVIFFCSRVSWIIYPASALMEAARPLRNVLSLVKGEQSARNYLCRQGCQMVSFQTKNPNLGKFWRAP
jgi:hypothetical protein